MAYRLLERNGFTRDDLQEIQYEYQNRQIKESNEFGLMNYSFSFPLSLSLGQRWTMIMNYTYNIPLPLSHEVISPEPSSFVSLSLSYRIMFIQQGK
ncbi:MAG: hypothetical protein HC842_01185 [Cytophagales bacterium]|nr:hypothetical protein [Cytophagales bacterium]